MNTYYPKAGEILAQRRWYIVDATNKPLGRLAAKIAFYLRGKHKPEFTPHADMGDYIIVINADKIAVTGNKAKDKIYYRHSGYPGGLTEMPFEKMVAKFPTRPIEIAVKGMLPKNSLGRDMFRKLKVYAGAQHEHSAQNPQPIELL